MERTTKELEREAALQKVLDEAAPEIFGGAGESVDPRLGGFKVFLRPGDEGWTAVFFQGGTVLFGQSLDDAAAAALDGPALVALFDEHMEEIHESIERDRMKKMERDLLPVVEAELRRLLEGRVDAAVLEDLDVEIEDLRGTPGFAPDGAPWPHPAVVVTHLELEELALHLALDFFDPGRVIDVESLAEELAEKLA